MNFSELMKQMVNLWKETSILKKISLGIFLVVVFSGLILIYSRAQKVEYATLYSGLEPQEAGIIIDKLKSSKIPYRIKEGGKMISVPYDKVDEVRLNFAKEGLPQSGVGYEIFDKKTWGISDFVQKINYKRALEGELTRTIKEMEEIEFARVHLVLPEERLFRENQKEPSASVLIKLKPGLDLSSLQVQGMAWLLAHSIEGLSLSNISIIDFNGNILFPEEKMLSPLAGENKVTLDSYEKGQVNRANLTPDAKTKSLDRPDSKKGNIVSSVSRYFWILFPGIIILLLFKALKSFSQRRAFQELNISGRNQTPFETDQRRGEFQNNLNELQIIDSQRYLELLVDENPQVISVVLAQLQPTRAAEILSKLPKDKQIEVALNLSRIEKFPFEIKKRIWQAFESQLLPEKRGSSTLVSEEQPNLNSGNLVLKEILKHTNKTTRKKLSQIRQKDFLRV